MKQIVVTDHALLRWLEREHGLDVEFFRRLISDKVNVPAKCGSISLQDGNVKFIIRQTKSVATVTTVLERWMPTGISKSKGEA